MAKQSPQRDVTKAEFIEAFVKSGGSQEDAEKTAHISAALGSSVLVGKEMLTIKDEVQQDDTGMP
jgi:hypothetical protein